MRIIRTEKEIINKLRELTAVESKDLSDAGLSKNIGWLECLLWILNKERIE